MLFLVLNAEQERYGRSPLEGEIWGLTGEWSMTFDFYGTYRDVNMAGRFLVYADRDTVLSSGDR